MKDSEAPKILAWLQAVERERAARTGDELLAERVDAVKAYQHARFCRTYADLLAQPKYAPAAQFFLDELYGPKDFSRRDAQFARVVPALVRLFPAEIVQTVSRLGELHALSERLDTAMAARVPAGLVGDTAYRDAWQLTDNREMREHQIELTVEIGRSLARFTKNPVLRHSLRMMRAPARLAGLGELQNFLELGFDTFRALQDPQGFLDVIAARERSIAKSLFADDASPVA